MNRPLEALWPRVSQVIANLVSEVMPPSRAVIEARYLNEANDIYDLEYRIRELDRRAPSQAFHVGSRLAH